MRVGHQTYSWEMQGERWRGSPEDILDAVAAAGYQGVEFSNVMIGDFWDRPDEFGRRWTSADWCWRRLPTRGPDSPTRPATKRTWPGAEKRCVLPRGFGARSRLAGPSSPSRDDYERKFAQACRFCNEVARRAKKLGVTVAVHPHSHHTSLVLTGAEYDRLLAATEASGLMFNPDTGHIFRGGQDLLECCRRHGQRVVHVHCKDVDAQDHWQPLGRGICDFPGLVKWLAEIGYRGWLISEEESELVWKDLPGAMAQNRAYFRSSGLLKTHRAPDRPCEVLP